MRTILGFLAITVFATLGLFYVLATVLVQLLPIFAVAAAIVVVCQAATRRRRSLGGPASMQPRRAHVAAPQGHWVYLPVWVAPKPRQMRPYIDAEVIEEYRGG
ncbi:MAG: hypothetical protein QOE30_3935 [Mycobacterium sp.]|jgi:hypothetical protein|uniref:hypothetical protein n=1 Tax=Mycobacterium sp. TaxID=1785 RepID=UPI0028B3B78B|nr:hypothetical protein [Mycobacterium sp.]MDT5118196.1 hypothetical protein [Mycobacterium sp.]